jgi:hypothetical protein
MSEAVRDADRRAAVTVELYPRLIGLPTIVVLAAADFPHLYDAYRSFLNF